MNNTEKLQQKKSSYGICLMLSVAVWGATFLTAGIFPGWILLGVTKSILEGLRLIPVFKANGERWWGVMCLISFFWPFCFFISVAITRQIGKKFNGIAYAFLWFFLFALLTLTLAYSIISPTMKVQFQEKAEAQKYWAERDRAR